MYVDIISNTSNVVKSSFGFPLPTSKAIDWAPLSPPDTRFIIIPPTSYKPTTNTNMLSAAQPITPSNPTKNTSIVMVSNDYLQQAIDGYWDDYWWYKLNPESGVIHVLRSMSGLEFYRIHLAVPNEQSECTMNASIRVAKIEKVVRKDWNTTLKDDIDALRYIVQIPIEFANESTNTGHSDPKQTLLKDGGRPKQTSLKDGERPKQTFLKDGERPKQQTAKRSSETRFLKWKKKMQEGGCTCL
jgi:hypothetical protein